MAEPEHLDSPHLGERSLDPKAPDSAPLGTFQRGAVFQYHRPISSRGITLSLVFVSLIAAMLVLGQGCVNEPPPTSATSPTATRYVPRPASQSVAEQAIAKINQHMRTIAYNERLYAPTNLHMRMSCDHVLAASTGMRVPAWYQDMAGPEMVAAIRLIGELHQNDWQDYCRVINGAQGTWVRYGSGKWDAAIAKYGPTPAPTSSQAEHAMKAIYEAIKGTAGTLPSSEVILLGCNKLLFGGGGTGVIDPAKQVEDKVGWILHDRILEAAGADWPDFCRVHSGKNGDLLAIGTGKWDEAIPTQ